MQTLSLGVKGLISLQVDVGDVLTALGQVFSRTLTPPPLSHHFPLNNIDKTNCKSTPIFERGFYSLFCMTCRNEQSGITFCMLGGDTFTRRSIIFLKIRILEV